MTEPMTDQRLAEIRAASDLVEGGRPWDTDNAVEAFGHVRELLTEVERMRALDVPTRFLHVDLEDVTPEQIAEWQAAWDKLCPGVVGYDYTPPPVLDPPPAVPMRNLLRDAADPCPYSGVEGDWPGAQRCALPMQTHYHYCERPGSGVEVVYYDSDRARQIEAKERFRG